MAYRPQAPYTELKRVSSFIEQAQTIEDLRYIAATEGTQIGYRALGRLLADKMTPEQMKPDEARATRAAQATNQALLTPAPFDVQVEKILANPSFFPELDGDQLAPYDFQVDGIRFLATNPTALLGDEMGLGKTVQAIGAIKILFAIKKIQKVLVLCPRSLIAQWQHEFKRFAPELFVQKVRGTPDDRLRHWRSGAAIKITSYETWRSDWNRIPGNRPHFDLAVLDEIQRIKNPDTAIAKSVHRIKAAYRWGLSGTPLENRVDDVVAIFEFLNPALFRHVDPPYSPELVKRLMAPQFLRRKVGGVGLNLPPKLSYPVWLELSEGQQETYNQFELEARRRLEEPNATRVHVFAQINRLKQICNYDERTQTSGKLDYLLEELETVVDNGQKAIVFSQFPNKTLQAISSRLSHFRPALFDGALTDKQADRMLKRFQNRPEPTVLLASVRSGGTGLNLTRANHVFHFDQWWNPAVTLQAEGRAYRIGQKLPVFVHSMFMINTIEERIHSLLQTKRQLFDRVIDELSEQEIQGALSDAELFGLFGLEPPKRNTAKKRRRLGYRPSAPYQAMKTVERSLDSARSVKEVRALARTHCPKIGYKAFCYLLAQLATPEEMKGKQ